MDVVRALQFANIGGDRLDRGVAGTREVADGGAPVDYPLRSKECHGEVSVRGRGGCGQDGGRESGGLEGSASAQQSGSFAPASDPRPEADDAEVSAIRQSERNSQVGRRHDSGGSEIVASGQSSSARGRDSPCAASDYLRCVARRERGGGLW